MSSRAREFPTFEPSSSRRIFARSDSSSSSTLFSSSFGRAPAHLTPSPRTRSYFSSSGVTCRSTFESSSSTDVQEEDQALLTLAATACAQVEHARSTFGRTSGWKERKEGAGVRVFERKTRPETFDVAASTALTCSATEILNLLSSRHSDDFNATMVALAGDAFAYAVTLREVPTTSATMHLSIKRVTFSGAMPLVCSAKTIEFLDYVEVDAKTRTAIRTFHTLTRDQTGRLLLGGDVIAGYVLSEEMKLHQTSVFYFGTHTMMSCAAVLKAKGIVKAKLKAATGREATAQALLKLARAIPKIGEITIRRRLGAVDTTDPADSIADGSCSGCGKLVKVSLLRKKHVCYMCSHHVCGSCSKSQDVETLIGVIERARVCCMCIAAARHRAFETLDQLEDRPVYLLRPSTISVLSATSTSAATSVDSTGSQSRRLPASARG